MHEIDSREHYLSEFTRFEGQIADDHGWLLNLRRGAIDRFAELGFPTPRQEEWRFTDVTPLARRPFHLASGNVELRVQSAIELIDSGYDGPAAARLVFMNGRFSPALSELQGLPAGVKVMSLAAALEQEQALIQPHLAQVALDETHPFLALNTAFMEDGAFIQIPRGLYVEKPLHLVYLSTQEPEPVVSHPRNLFVVGESGQVSIIESYVGAHGHEYFINAVTEVVVGEDAIVDHYKLQQESEAAFHMATLAIRQGTSSRYTSYSLADGAALARTDIGALLDGDGVECNLNGLYLATDHQHIDYHTQIEHARSHGTSHQVYKGILDGHASGVFNGRILVRTEGQKTDAIQSSRNLLLSDTATINAQPQLKIYADDVRCTHGATVGQLAADAIFYLRSRGIDPESARGLLTYAFANEVIEMFKIEPLRHRLERLIYARFQKGAISAEV